MPAPKLRYAAKAILIEDGRLLCLRKRGDIGVYYVLPGGGQEPGELLTETLARECLEELGARVEPGRLRFVQEYVGRNHLFKDAHGGMHFVNLYFEARLLERPLTRPLVPDAGQEALEWLPLERLPEAAFFPRVLAGRLARPAAGGSPDEGASGDGIGYLGDSV
jgi:8-oxo-dGTP pyrophosphatase MutT (NUDIX family)